MATKGLIGFYGLESWWETTFTMEEKKLSLFETQKAIKYIKDLFQNTFSKSLNLHRITGPIVLKQHTGLNDDLNGVENPVRFESNVNSIKGEIPQSLAK